MGAAVEPAQRAGLDGRRRVGWAGGHGAARRSALGAGALLAFGLSFDEIIVTTFTAGPGIQTLPLWIFQNLFRPNQAPVVNVIAAVLVLVSVLPVYLANRLSADTATGGRM